MKTSIYLIVATLIIGLFIYSCEKEKSYSPQLDFSGKLISKSACKSLTNYNIPSGTTVTPDSISCVKYSYDNSTNKLTLNHINAGFNCCPDSMNCKISLSNDTIIVQEIEKGPKCNCSCLFDLNIEVNGIESKIYQIKFIEPYAKTIKKLIFSVDLSKDIVGSYSVVRKQYPWF